MATTSPPDKVVFLCHAGENKAFVRQLVDRLETDGLRRDQIFYDEISLQPGDELDNIIKVIESASMKLFIFVVSKYCFQSNKTWIRAEWESALENNKQIFPIWLDDNNDGFKAFGNLVREFSYKLRKIIAQRVNTQEISTSLHGLSEKICLLVFGDQPTQQMLSPSTVHAFPAPRHNMLPGILKSTSVDNLSRLMCKSNGNLDNPNLKGLDLAIISTQVSSFSEWVANPVTRHFAHKMRQKSQQVTDLEGKLEMKKQQAEIQENVLKSLRREVFNLNKKEEDAQKDLLNKTEEIRQLKETIRGMESQIEELRNAMSQQVAALEGRLDKAKQQAVVQEDIVKSLYKEVTHLKNKDESAQKVLLNKTEEIKQLQETNRYLEKENEELRNAKMLKWPFRGLEEVSAKKEATWLGKSWLGVRGLLDSPKEEAVEDKITRSSGGDVRTVKVNTESRQAVVTFQEDSEEAVRSILVSNIPEGVNRDILEIYFMRRSHGGGDIESITMVTFDEAKITYLDSESL